MIENLQSIEGGDQTIPRLIKVQIRKITQSDGVKQRGCVFVRVGSASDFVDDDESIQCGYLIIAIDVAWSEKVLPWAGRIHVDDRTVGLVQCRLQKCVSSKCRRFQIPFTEVIESELIAIGRQHGDFFVVRIHAHDGIAIERDDLTHGASQIECLELFHCNRRVSQIK